MVDTASSSTVVPSLCLIKDLSPRGLTNAAECVILEVVYGGVFIRLLFSYLIHYAFVCSVPSIEHLCNPDGEEV